jgi:hypothetical protein
MVTRYRRCQLHVTLMVSISDDQIARDEIGSGRLYVGKGDIAAALLDEVGNSDTHPAAFFFCPNPIGCVSGLWRL